MAVKGPGSLTKLKPRLAPADQANPKPARYSKVGSTRDYRDRRNQKYRNKNVQSKRRVSLGKRKDESVKFDTSTRPQNEEKMDPQAAEVEKGANGRKEPKKHPRPNSPPPPPTHLQEPADQNAEDGRESAEGGAKETEGEDLSDLQEKVEFILDLQEDIMNLHLSAIREDAQMLKRESQIISNARSNDADYEIDNYIRDTENIVRKKLMLYKQISDKIKLAKKALAQENCFRQAKAPAERV